MAGSLCNAPTSEPAKVEQIITEFFTKSLHIILESRSPYASSRNYYSGDHFASSSSPSSSSSTSSIQPRDKWFNLALRDCPAALENLDLWRQSDLEPLVVDVILVKRPSRQDCPPPPPGGLLVRNLSAKDQYPNSWSSGQDELFNEKRSEKIVERWVVQYESRKSGSTARDSNSSGKRRSSGSSYSSEMTMHKKIYRRSILLMRSLYVTVRLLPAYKIFRDLNSSGQVRPFTLEHRISSFVEPFTRVEDAQMNQFSFTPVDTPCGRLCLSVSYLPTLEDVSSEPSTPLSTEFITDYVGSPLTDPLKRFQSLPSSEPLPTYVSFTRRHSWSNDHGATPSVSPSPSPAYSDSRALHSNPNPDPLPPPGLIIMDNSLPRSSISHNALLNHKKTTSFDECWPSPPFSPSPSSSPPTRLSSDNSLSTLLRTESAPVRIPPVRKNSALPYQALPPSSSPKGTRPRCYSQADSVRFQMSIASTSQSSPTERKFQVKQGPTRLGELQTGTTLQKVLSCGKADLGNVLGIRITSCSSPRLPIYGISSNLPDEFDDSGFVCPFAVDDEDIRSDPSDGKGQDIETSTFGGTLPVRISRDAAVGELVEMLRRAEPLGQVIPYSLKFLQASKDGTWNEGVQINKDVETGGSSLQNVATSSGAMPSLLFKSRTTSDALEELKSYREMKDLLLSQGGSQLLDAAEAVKHGGGGSSEV